MELASNNLMDLISPVFPTGPQTIFGTLAGSATEMEVPSKATMRVRTARVRKTSQNRAEGLKSLISGVSNIDPDREDDPERFGSASIRSFERSSDDVALDATTAWTTIWARGVVSIFQKKT